MFSAKANCEKALMTKEQERTSLFFSSQRLLKLVRGKAMPVSRKKQGRAMPFRLGGWQIKSYDSFEMPYHKFFPKNTTHPFFLSRPVHWPARRGSEPNTPTVKDETGLGFEKVSKAIHSL